MINFDKYMEVIKQSSSYEKLVSCLSEWMALMELCDDLLERLTLYGHMQYLDIKHASDTIREHWKTAPHEFSYKAAAFDGAIYDLIRSCYYAKL